MILSAKPGRNRCSAAQTKCEVNVVVRFQCDHVREAASRSPCVDFVGSSPLVCLVTDPSSSGEGLGVDLEGDQGEGGLLEMLQ